MRRERMESMGSTVSSHSSRSLEDKEETNKKCGILQAERELFRFFNLPFPRRHQHEWEAQQHLKQSDAGAGNISNNEDVFEDAENQQLLPDDPSSPPIVSLPPPTPLPPQISSHQPHQRGEPIISKNYPPYPLPPHPSTWPQRPAWIRAAPGTSTHIVGIRHVPGDLPEDFADQYPDLVPLNAGTEEEGHVLVVDFVTDHFIGSLLIRVRGIPSLIPSTKGADNSKTYFGTRQRTFQGVIRGRFRHPQPVYDCLSGQTFRRPAGKLPPQFIIKAFQALLARLAPHSSLELVGSKPRSLAPFVSTTQTIRVEPLPNNAEETQENDPGLVLHDGHFFYDSVYDDYINHSYSSNDASTMGKEFLEPHASHEHSLIYQAACQLPPEDLVDVHPPPLKSKDNNKNRKFRKRYFNRLLTHWKRNQQKLQKRKQQNQNRNRTQGHHHEDDVDGHDNDKDGLDKDSPPLPNFVFTTDKEYTFEFYENLVMFENPQKEFAMNLRLPLLRHIPISPATDGQPIQVMCAIPRRGNDGNDDNLQEGDGEEGKATTTTGWDDEYDYLWAFEVWHESLYEYACKAHGVDAGGV